MVTPPPRGSYDDRHARAEHAPRPLLILAHHDVVCERERLPERRGIAEFTFEKSVVSNVSSSPSLEVLDSRRSGRTGSRGSSARAAWRRRAAAGGRRRPPLLRPRSGPVSRREPGIVGRVRVLAREDERLAARELRAEVARAAVVELARRDRVDASAETSRRAPRCRPASPSRRRRPRPRRRPAGATIASRQRTRSAPPSFTGMTTEITCGYSVAAVVSRRSGMVRSARKKAPKTIWMPRPSAGDEERRLVRASERAESVRGPLERRRSASPTTAKRASAPPARSRARA